MGFEVTLAMLKNELKSDLPVDIYHYSSYDVFLRIVMNLGATLCIPMDAVNTMVRSYPIMKCLEQFDYKNSNFETLAKSFCSDIVRIVPWLIQTENLDVIVTVVSILIYTKNTDINLDEVNTCINSICNAIDGYEEKPSLPSQLDELAGFMQNNVVGQKILEIATSSQEKEVLSSADNLLGIRCANQPLEKDSSVQNDFMRTPAELGLPVANFLELNRRLQCNEPMTFPEVQCLFRSFMIDTNFIDLDKHKGEFTLYDLENVRICEWFYHLFDIICHVENNEIGVKILEQAVRRLLETDKKFLEFGYPYLTLAEIALNCLHAKVISHTDGKDNRYSYYVYIRAKNITYSEHAVFQYNGSSGEGFEAVNYVFNKIHELQSQIENDIADILEVKPLSQRKGRFVMRDFSRMIRDKVTYLLQDSANNDEVGITESANVIGMIETMEELSKEHDPESSDVKKLLGESFELSTMLETFIREYQKG